MLGLLETWVSDPYLNTGQQQDGDAPQRLWLSTSMGPPLQIGPLLPIHKEPAIALLQLLSAQLSTKSEATWRISKFTYVCFDDWANTPGWEHFVPELPTKRHSQCIRLRALPMFGEAKDASEPLLLAPGPTDAELQAAERDGQFDDFACYFDQWLFELAKLLGLHVIRPWHEVRYSERMESIRLATQRALPELRQQFLRGELPHFAVRIWHIQRDGSWTSLWLNVIDWLYSYQLTGMSQHDVEDADAPKAGQPWTASCLMITDFSTGTGASFQGGQTDAVNREYGIG